MGYFFAFALGVIVGAAGWTRVKAWAVDAFNKVRTTAGKG